jgi:hypothetical protein
MSKNAITGQPMTAAVVLFGKTRLSVNGLARALKRQKVHGFLRSSINGLPHAGMNVASKISRAGLRAVIDQIAAMAYEELHDHDLGAVLIAGCKEYESLRAAAERTLAHPDSVEVVEMRTTASAHTI